MMNKLLEFYAKSGPERLGIIVGDEIIELTNVHHNPMEGGSLSDNDMIKLSTADATWHTHPGQSATASMEDYDSFMSWPKHRHYIVGRDGVAIYTIQDGALVFDLCPLSE